MGTQFVLKFIIKTTAIAILVTAGSFGLKKPFGQSNEGRLITTKPRNCAGARAYYVRRVFG